MERYRIIIDTNLWISLLIGKRLSELYALCNDGQTVSADFILTGDRDLLSLQVHNKTKIVTFREFESILREQTGG
jgi:predicted nucleic acid-binding protein